MFGLLPVAYLPKRHWIVLLTLVACNYGDIAVAAADDASLLLSATLYRPAPQLPPLTGQELFERQWWQHDPQSRHGDGLGPMFNARSCAACHNQQQSGGGGDNSHNVDLLTLIDVAEDPSAAREDDPVPNGLRHAMDVQRRSRENLESLHAGFLTSNTVTLHAVSFAPKYAQFRTALLGVDGPQVRPIEVAYSVPRIITVARDAPPPPKRPHIVSVTHPLPQRLAVIAFDRFVLQQSQRNTPALLGAGLIDKISDAYFETAKLETQLRLQEKRSRNPDQLPGGSFGGKWHSMQFGRSIGAARFGWKGQTATLKAFVEGACANELGLQTKGNPQAVNPVDPEYHRAYVDMSAQQLDALVAFVASLPPPKRRIPASDAEATATVRGALLFGQARCQTCHVQDVENVQGLYSDLQLHDMGPDLSDPTGPATGRSRPSRRERPEPSAMNRLDPEHVAAATDRFPTSNSYFGPRQAELAALWRTPPLWGVRDSAPYLHDGRAATLDEAITLHGGEAAESAALYRNMSTDERRDLLTFVFSLGTP